MENNKPNDSKHADEYDVGYKKPPKTKQFKKGQSGNPKGRPKGSKNVATILFDILNNKVTVNEGGTTRQMTGLEAIIHNLALKAMKGDYRSALSVLKLAAEYDVNMPTAPASTSKEQRCGVLVVPGMLDEEAWNKRFGSGRIKSPGHEPSAGNGVLAGSPEVTEKEDSG